ncbi:LuxR C-terminal-related transcriptional regulator [Acrocarpospora sp. B8E8]|uniref:response regulator transcription factor n=1 Tax=Acrocarpospora sp. B8E8 TaxID=3153572 RepID=UPI00325E4E0F
MLTRRCVRGRASGRGWPATGPPGARWCRGRRFRVGLSPRRRRRCPHELLRMLLEGQTDERAARRLGLSLRTVRRSMSSLMTRLGARSRFQAGARAVQRGWL